MVKIVSKGKGLFSGKNLSGIKFSHKAINLVAKEDSVILKTMPFSLIGKGIRYKYFHGSAITRVNLKIH